MYSATHRKRKNPSIRWVHPVGIWGNRKLGLWHRQVVFHQLGTCSILSDVIHCVRHTHKEDAIEASSPSEDRNPNPAGMRISCPCVVLSRWLMGVAIRNLRCHTGAPLLYPRDSALAGVLMADVRTDTIGSRIRLLRQSRKVSLRGLAGQIGTTRSYIYDIERGRRFPSDDRIADIAHALDISPDEILRYDTRLPRAELAEIAVSDPLFNLAVRRLITEEVSSEEIFDYLDRRSGARPSGA